MQRIDISNRSRKSIQQFAEAVPTSSRRYISCVVCVRNMNRDYVLRKNQLKTVLSCGILLGLIPALTSLSLGLGDWAAVLPSTTLAGLEELRIEGWDDDFRGARDNFDLISLVKRCPC